MKTLIKRKIHLKHIIFNKITHFWFIFSFLPPHSYIDAAYLGYEDTAQKMIELIKNKKAYLEYFKWRKHYQYSAETKSVCELCAAINRNITKVYKNFRNWWYPVYELYEICGDYLNSYPTKDTANMRKEINWLFVILNRLGAKIVLISDLLYYAESTRRDYILKFWISWIVIR